ncbi:MAG: glycosyltransferase [Gaiellaceae bacterium]
MRVLFCSTGGDGHLLPLLPLARAFARRGAEVAVAAPSGLQAHVEAAGLRLVATGPDRSAFEPRMSAVRARVQTLPPSERRAVTFSTRFGRFEAPDRLEPLLDAVGRWSPELVVHESADLAAPIVAEAAGVPSVHHAFGLSIPEAALVRAGEAVAPLRERLGLAAAPFAGVYRGPYVEITPPSLAGALPIDREHVRPLRPVDPVGDGEAPRRARPLVYVTLGTVFNTPPLFRMLLAALAPLPCDVLVTTGRNLDLTELGPIPPNAEVTQYRPQSQVLPRCDVVVAHGGSGSFLGALAHGRPLVLLPQGADQFDNAAACAAIGVAETLLPHELTVERARAALELVLSEPRYGVEARRLAVEIAAMPSADAVAAGLARAHG